MTPISNAPEFAETVENGDMFACEICHDFVSEDDTFCPDCHVGNCADCHKPLEAAEVGDRDICEPSYMLCRACYTHENGLPAPGPAPTVINLLREMKRLSDAKKELQPHEKVLLYALR